MFATRTIGRRTLFLLSAFVALSAAMFVWGHAEAADPVPTKILTITPSTQKPTVEPGQTIRSSFQIINQGQQTYPVKVYSAPYSVQGEEYTPDFTALPGRPNVTDWLQFGTTASTIKPGETFTVPYTLSVPAGTQPGGYYLVAFVQTEPSKNGQGVLINERVGEIFYIKVAGEVKQAGKLASWSAPFLQKKPLAADLRLENDGGVHYVSNVRLDVRDVFGNSKYTLSTQKVILPQTIRKIALNWDKAPPFGLFKVTGSATVLDKTQTLQTKYVLVVSPVVRIVLVALLGVLIAFWLGRSLARRRSKRKADSSPS